MSTRTTSTRAPARARRITVVAAVAAAGVGIGLGAAASAPVSARLAAPHAATVLRDASGAQVGTATFVEDGTGRVHINVKVSGLRPGEHGLHVHAVGSCAGDGFAGAGGHHNPRAVAHGSHGGDFPNLVVNGAGQGRLNARSLRLTLSPGTTTVFDTGGSALIIHADRDDGFTDPTGNSGARIACGVIQPT